MANIIAEMDSAAIWAWALAFAGIAGVLAGSFYRVWAAIMLSFSVLVATTIIGINQSWSFWQGTLSALSLIAMLQLGYLVGAILASTGGKLRGALARSRWSALLKRDVRADRQRSG